jgi:hypothetical protein
MGSLDPFQHLKHKLWPKEWLGVKLVVWFPTTKSWGKSRESPQFPHVQVACDIPLEISQQELQLCFRPHCNRRFAHKIMKPQSRESFNSRNSGSPETKCHLDVGLMERHRVYYKREGGGFPKSEPWWVLLVWSCPWLVLTPKVLKLCTNHLVI